MRKILIVSFTLALALLFSASVYAGEGSDTIGACKLLPQLRYDYSSVNFEKYPAESGFQNWDNRTNAYYLQVNWGLFKNFDVIGLVGGEMTLSDSKWTPTTTTLEMKSASPMFLWGLGVKGTFFRADNGFYVGGGALFKMAISGAYDVHKYVNGVYNGENQGYHRTDYQLIPELHVGYHFKNIALTPYLGVDYVWNKTHVETATDDYVNLKYTHPVFMFTGIDYYLNDKLYINVEGRGNFVDGWGVGSGVGYLFDICGAPAPEPVPAPAPVIEPKLEPMSKN